MPPTTRRSPRVVTVSEGAKVTPAELFLDLVFVYAFTQVTGFMGDDLTWDGIARGLAILGLLWWLWTGFAWLGNLVRADEGPVRIVLFVVMAVVFVLAVTIPEAFVDDNDGGLWGPWVFAVGYLLVMLIHNGAMLYAGRELPRIRRNTLLMLAPALLATALLFAAGKQGSQTAQTWLWIAAMAVMFVGIFFIRPEGWLIGAASHFAERHGLIIIVALGETVVAIGVALTAKPTSWQIVAGAVLSVVVMAMLWWAYFDVVAPVGESLLQELSEDERPKIARDSYSFLHFPMVAGIIVMALGMKKSFEDLGAPLKPLPVLCLFGGAAVYLLAHVAFRLRNATKLNVQRLVVAVLLCALTPVAMRLPALASLLLLAGIMIGLVVYESVVFAGSRRRIRQGDASLEE